MCKQLIVTQLQSCSAMIPKFSTSDGNVLLLVEAYKVCFYVVGAGRHSGEFSCFAVPCTQSSTAPCPARGQLRTWSQTHRVP